MRLSLIVLAFVLGTLGCGGSGSDSGSGSGGSDSGSVSVTLTPETVNEGSLAFLNVHFDQADFDDLDTQGITIKLFIPSELDIVADSPTLTLTNGGASITPLAVAEVPGDFAVDELQSQGVLGENGNVENGEFTMYVFPLEADLLQGEDHGTLQATFEVKGRPVHPVILTDIDRGAISRFDINHADFDAESLTRFTINTTEE